MIKHDKQVQEKLKAFLEYYSRLHEVAGAYNATSQAQSFHRRASLSLFEQSKDFLETLPYDDIQKVLDIGSGYGHHCEYFASRGLNTTGITVHISEELRIKASRNGFCVEGMDMHFLDFDDNSFDLLWSSHCLEHSFSPLLALREWLRVIKPGKYLAVSVPPHKNEIVSGHFNVGWNVGQLIYLLAAAGFDLEEAIVEKKGYNIRGLVKKPLVPVDTAGMCWMFRLKERLPPAIKEVLKETPKSLGRYSFPGEFLKVSRDGLEHESPKKSDSGSFLKRLSSWRRRGNKK